MDILYGVGAGAIFGGLIVAASVSSKAGRQIAAGGLIGGLGGMGLGMYELTNRDCRYVSLPSPGFSLWYWWQRRAMVSGGATAQGL